ncbi:MBL fold metallo-hydrolase [Occallatibacter riparius]|uniref:MBL fold metallo-hydrolase n=1 Tax=Occallatibacter riparius TaxID=1002689 RepID=A0A9J7BJ82_9BACT|nr:rhodanese-like domain-containing protein [Occallatibacter riparius]UWZ81850.1 MBL fold metallo-hydrolase [Occallatibacter riparius]
MEIDRFYLGCLAHASYLIWDGGEAAVVDPQRDVDIYVEAARSRGVEIRWIFETHLHADFVSGHVELAERTGATICLGEGSGAGFAHRSLADGEEILFGSGLLRVMATPGHTEESICIAAVDPAKEPQPFAVMTGDTLFVGDVGRPDLSDRHTPQELAGMLYDSVHQKLLLLPDDALAYPAHGAGSLCGKQMSADASSTIGRERRSNYALQAKSREQFVELLTSDLPARPAYFHDEVQRNRAGAASLSDQKPLEGLTPEALRRAMADPEAVVLDTRPVMQFACAHIPGSVHIGLSGQFASWAARLIGLAASVVLVTEDEKAIEESRTRLARVGMENVIGFLQGGLVRWIQAGYAVNYVPQVSVQEVAEWRAREDGSPTILDVREAGERSTGSLAGSINIPLGQLPTRTAELDRSRMLFVHCKGGYRSSAATSLLQRMGFENIANMTGGFDAWQTAFPEIT